MTVYKHMFLLFGGIQEVTKELDDLYIFDTNTSKFKVISNIE